MFATFVLQASLLVAPLTTGDAPPETRALAAVRFGTSEGNGFRYDVATPERWRAKAKAGEEFLAFARSCAANPTAIATGLVGTYWRPMLAQDTGDFLFSAAIGDVNEYEPARDAEHRPLVALRIERDAACRQIFVSGTDAGARAKADAIVRELRAGADFAALARERSDDRASALRGGDFAIFERGPHDALLREAAFNLKPGEISGVITSPLGFHILQRVEVSALDPRLRDDLWAHARGILIAFGGAKGADPALVREHDEAERIANELAARIRRGDDMVALAKEFNDDGRGEHGGRARAGDLGWVRRATTAMPQFMDRLFTEVPGTLIGPIASEAGFVIFRREDPGLRSHIDLRKSAFVDLEQSVRKLAEAKTDPPAIAGLGKAVAAARALDAAFGSPLEWGRIEGLLPVSPSAADFVAHCKELNESETLAGGTTIVLRELATQFAAALVSLEPGHVPDVPLSDMSKRVEYWPEHELTINTSLYALRQQLSPFGDTALDELMRALGIDDPREVIPVYLVAEGPWPGGVTHRATRGAVSLIDADENAGTQLLEVVLHESTHALDLASHDQKGVLDELRARLASAGIDRTNRLSRDIPHTLMFVTSAWVVRRVFDPAHKDYGDVSGYYAKLPTATKCVRDPWTDFLSGKKTRAEALDAIVAAAQAAK